MTNTSVESADAGCSTSRPIRLDELPLEVLLLIFDYCHAFDLVRLSSVCTRFYDIACDEVLWYKRGNQSLATNQVSNRFRSRCNPLLRPRSKWQVTHNWEYGCYQRNILFSQKTKLMPWIQLTGDILWWTGGNRICAYRRTDPFNSRNVIFHKNTHSDVSKFVVRDNYVISGHRDGSIKFWLKDYYHLNHYSIDRAHSRDVNAVDETKDIVVSGSTDGEIKAWTSPKCREDFFFQAPLATVRFHDRIWSLSADPTGTKVAIGTSGITSSPLYICNSMNFVQPEVLHDDFCPWRPGAGILDMVWDDPHTLLTCGYDTYIRKWDLRTGKSVGHWADPTDATIYCISSDYNCTMVTGTQFNSKAVLWDQRKPQYIQLYFMNLQRMSSPIYSVSFDSSHLYGATDQNVIEVKFSGQPNIKKNFREIMKYEKFISFQR